MEHAVGWLVIACLTLAAFANGGGSLVRVFKDAALIEISADGRLMLARRSPRKTTDCPDRLPSCSVDVLDVFDVATGKSLGQLEFRGSFNFGLARFLPDHTVLAVEQDWKSSPVRIAWDPASGRRSEARLDFPNDARLVCALNDTDFLAHIADRSVRPWIHRLGILNRTGFERLKQPDLPFVQMGVPLSSAAAWDCAGRLRKDSFLVAAGAQDASLDWVSLHPNVSARPCHVFESERIRNFALSPDGSEIAVATDAVESASERGKLHPEHPLWLTVLESSNCSVLRRFQLDFPEKQKLRSPLLGSYQYYDNAHFGAQFPARMAVSPDKTMLAVAYGVYRSPSGYAYFGLYSLRDGHRLTTLKGDVLHMWPWSGFLNDQIRAPSAPIHGALRFSDDSGFLFGSSRHLRQWDVSRLK